MVRKYVKKTDKAEISPTKYLHALKQVRTGLSIRKSATQYGVKHQTLFKFHKKLKDIDTEQLTRANFEYGKHGIRQIFSDKQEDILKDYLITCAQMNCGLSPEDVRKLAYELGDINKVDMPPSWRENKEAGPDWFASFMCRKNKDVSIRKPEQCSLARSSSFNEHNIKIFFGKLKEALNRHPSFLDGTRVYNLDECGVSTVACVGKIVAPKGQKQIYQTTSQERGTLVTACMIVGATGTLIPPVMVFPRKTFKKNMLIGGFPGTLGLAAASGWMNSELYPEVLQHFIKFTGSSKDNPTLLLCDNHESHISIKALDLAKEKGVTVLTFVPHTTHRMQPLDVSVMGPFKKAYNKAMSDWMRNNAGETCSIYDIASLVNTALSKAATPANIIAGFKATGIQPFNEDIFDKSDFLPSKLTDRPVPVESFTVNSVANANIDLTLGSQVEIATENGPEDAGYQVEISRPTEYMQAEVETEIGLSTSTEHEISNALEESNTSLRLEESEGNISRPISASTPSPTSRDHAFVSPEIFRGYPKPKPRKATRKAREKGRSMIATDTPEKEAIAEKHALKESSKIIPNKKSKKSKTSKRMLFGSNESAKENDISLAHEVTGGDSVVERTKSKKNKKGPQKAFKKKEKKKTTQKKSNKRRIVEEVESSAEEENTEVIYEESDKDSYIESEEEELPFSFKNLPHSPVVGEFVLVEFTKKDKLSYYIGEVTKEKDQDGDLEVSYLRRSSDCKDKFVKPIICDIASVVEKDIKMILPKPSTAGTKRQKNLLKFHVDLSYYNVE